MRTEQSLALFWQACGAAGPLQIQVTGPGAPAAARREFEKPFLLAGGSSRADLVLKGPEVSRRHAYLQVIAGRLFCVDLQSRSGLLWDGRPQRYGWLAPGQALAIGPFTIQLLGEGPAGPASPAADRNPLASCPFEEDLLPPVSLEVLIGSRKCTSWRMNQVLAVVGRSPDCQAQIPDEEVSRSHCSLLRTPLGLWVIDLLGKAGTSVNGTAVRWARLEDGDELRIASHALGVRYQPVSSPATDVIPSPGSVVEATAAQVSAVLPEDGLRAELDRLRNEQQAAAAEVERLQTQLGVLERTLAEATATRDGLLKDHEEARGRWETEQQAIRDSWEREKGGRVRAEQQAQIEATTLRQGQEQLEQARQLSDQECQRLQQEVENLRQQAEAARQECEQLTLQHEQAAGDHRIAAEQVQQLRAELEGQRQEALSLRGELEGRHGEAQRLYQQAEAAHQQALGAACAEAAAARQHGQEQLELARRQFDQEQQTLQHEVLRLRQEADKASLECAGLAAEHEQAQGSRREATEEVQSLRTELEGERREIECLRQQAAAAQQESGQQTQSLQTELERQRREVERLHQEVQTRQQALQAAQTEAAALRRQGQEQLEAVRGGFDQERLRLQRQAEGIHQQFHAARQACERLTEQHRQATDGLGAAAERVRTLEAQLEEQRGEAARARQEAERVRQERAQQTRECEELTTQREQAMGAGRKAAEQVQSLQAELERQRRQVEGLRQEVQAHQQAHRAAHAEAAAVRQQEQEQLGLAHTQFDQERQRLQQEVEGLHQQLHAAQQERETLQGQVDALSQGRERLAAVCKQPVASHEQTKQRFAAAVARYTQLVDQIQSLKTEIAMQQARPSATARVLGRLWSSFARKGETGDQEALYRRLEALRTEASSEREQLDRASAEAVLADLERQLAEARRWFVEVSERAVRLEAELQEYRERGGLGVPLKTPPPEGELTSR